MLYNSTNRIRFSAISDRYQIPKQYKGELSKVHGKLITYVTDHYSDTKKYRQKVTDALNILTYSILEHEVPPFNWSVESPLATMPDVDMSLIESKLGMLFLTPDGIEWDVKPADNFSEPTITSTSSPTTISAASITPPPSAFTSQPAKKVTISEMKRAINETQKEDLYIKAPTYPQFDYNKPWLYMTEGADKLVIYTTLPEIPTKQNEISITTNVNGISESELIALYPDKLIRTRSAMMYEPVDGLEFDSELGVIIPVLDYSVDKLKDNIVRYPHLYKLQRMVGEEIRSFYNDIEIDGRLYPIGEVWDSLPDSKLIPRQSEYIKEYIVRRYILEEESGVDHKFKMYGTLDPFLTLFMPLSDYIKLGHTDTTELARQCVRSRVSFKQSRNPVLRRLNLLNTN